MGRRARTLVAGVDAVAMAAFAYAQTGVPRVINSADLILWGAVLAAAVCAYVTYTNGVAFIAWAAIGYVLFGGLLTRGSPHGGLLLLAVALMPLVPRPHGSVMTGIGVAVVAAIVSYLIFAAVL